MAMPDWALYALFGVGGLFLLFMGIWIGRRSTQVGIAETREIDQLEDQIASVLIRHPDVTYEEIGDLVEKGID